MDFTLENNLIAAILKKLEAYQAEYIKTHPVFFQGLRTHSKTPEINTVADKLATKPSSKTSSWLDMNVKELSDPLPFSISIDEYVSPKQEKGWQVIFRIIKAGKEFQKSVGYGVEAQSRTYEWKEIIPQNHGAN